MEDIIFQVYGNLILTLAGFVLPIIAIALSLFPEGFKVLKQKYESEQKQAEGNLAIELEKQKNNKEIDYNELSKTIATLKSTKRKSKKRLSYLSPASIVSKSVIGVGVSLTSFLLGMYLISIYFYNPVIILPFSVSIIFLVWVLIIFSNAIEIIIEASIAVQEIRRSVEEKNLELLTTLADNSKKGDSSMFIDEELIRAYFHGDKVVSGKKYVFSVNKKHSIEIRLINSSDYMLKTAELGFTFPKEFLVEGNSISSIYTTDTQNFIRFKHDYIQCHASQIEGNIDITFLKLGVFSVDAFIRGENLKNKVMSFQIEVIP